MNDFLEKIWLSNPVKRLSYRFRYNSFCTAVQTIYFTVLCRVVIPGV